MLDTIVEMNQLKIARVKVNMKGAFSDENRFISIAGPIRKSCNSSIYATKGKRAANPERRDHKDGTFMTSGR